MFRGDVSRLLSRINSAYVLGGVVGDAAELHDVIRSNAMSYVDFYSAESVELKRAHVRYLAALFPKATMSELVDLIFDILDNSHVSKQDVRLILGGFSLHDASKRLQDTPVEVLQKVGEMLSDGRSHAEIARMIRVSEDTVGRVDRFLGLSDAWRSRQVAAAVDAVRDGLSVREFARSQGLSKTTAHRMIVEARNIIKEVGE